MRTHIIIAIGMAGVFGAMPNDANSQSATRINEPVSRIARAIELQQEAIALHSEPLRASEAARLHKESAYLRNASDPEAVQCLAMAAHLFNYAKRPMDARKTMEEAAERALAMGDVVRAAQAYVEATFFADRQQNSRDVNRLGRKALLLTSSPLLKPEERTAIVNRIRSNPSLASLVK